MLSPDERLRTSLEEARQQHDADHTGKLERAQEQKERAIVRRMVDTEWVPWANQIAYEQIDAADLHDFISGWATIIPAVEEDGSSKEGSYSLQAQVTKTAGPIGTRQIDIYVRLSDGERENVFSDAEHVILIDCDQSKIFLLNPDTRIETERREEALPSNEIAWRSMRSSFAQLQRADFPVPEQTTDK